MIQRVLHIGTHESVIDDDQDAMTMGNCCNLLNIHQPQRWIRGRFDPHQLGILRMNQGLHVQLNTRTERHLHAMCLGNLGKVPVRSTVDIRNGNNMRSRGQGLENRGRSGRARSKRQGIFRVLESCDSLLEVFSEKDHKI